MYVPTQQRGLGQVLPTGFSLAGNCDAKSGQPSGYNTGYSLFYDASQTLANSRCLNATNAAELVATGCVQTGPNAGWGVCKPGDAPVLASGAGSSGSGSSGGSGSGSSGGSAAGSTVGVLSNQTLLLIAAAGLVLILVIK